MKKLALTLVLVIFLMGIFAYAENTAENNPDPATVVQEANKVLDELWSNVNKEKLATGKIQTFIVGRNGNGKGEKARVGGIVLINTPPAAVHRAIEEWWKQLEWIPVMDVYEVKYSYPQESLPKGVQRKWLVNVGIKFAFLFTAHTALERTLYSVDPDTGREIETFRLIKEDEVKYWKEHGIDLFSPFWMTKDIGGFGCLEPYENGEKTVYYFAPILETVIPIPGPMERAGMKITLPGYVSNMKKRVESEYAGTSGKKM